MPTPDLMLFDFLRQRGGTSASRTPCAWPPPIRRRPLLLWHWGCVDAPDFAPFNGDPERLKAVWSTPAGCWWQPLASRSP